MHSLTPVCTKSFVGWGFAPDPTGGAYIAPQSIYLWHLCSRVQRFGYKMMCNVCLVDVGKPVIDMVW